MTEHTEQVALFQWAAYNLANYPELGLMFAVPNGGARHPAVAQKLKDEGVKRGVPDIFLSVPRGKYHGMYLEFKFGKNSCTPEQLSWIDKLREQGYYCRVVWCWQDAVTMITNYLEGKYERNQIDLRK